MSKLHAMSPRRGYKQLLLIQLVIGWMRRPLRVSVDYSPHGRYRKMGLLGSVRPRFWRQHAGSHESISSDAAQLPFLSASAALARSTSSATRGAEGSLGASFTNASYSRRESSMRSRFS